MKQIRLYYNPSCGRCRRISKVDRLLDWRKRLEVSTAAPKGGPLRMGEIAVEILATGQEVRGVQAFDQLTRHIPLYGIVRPLLSFAWFRNFIDRTMSNCVDGACRI